MRSAPIYRFGDFSLDVADRRLTRAGMPVDLAPRTFDALALLVREEGRLVPKTRFFDEVWAEAAVGDEALTQCIKTLRRQLGDEAANPRFILTVPKHGYRFVAPVEVEDASESSERDPPAAIDGPVVAGVSLTPPIDGVPAGTRQTAAPAPLHPRRSPAGGIGIASATTSATIGGMLAGLVGGLLYSALLIAPADAEVGRTSLSVLLFALNAMVGALGGLGLGLGYGVAAAVSRYAVVRIAAAAIGGLAVGTVSRLLGVDAFNLVLGEGPVGITGGAEGATLSAFIVAGFLIARRERLRPFGAAIGGGIAGLLIVALGGRLMAGSLERLAETLADQRALAPLAPFLANAVFSDWADLLLGCVEGAVFGGGVGLALMLAQRRAARGESPVHPTG